MLFMQIKFKYKKNYQENSDIFFNVKNLLCHSRDCCKKTIPGIKSILVYSEAVYNYEKNEGSYHSGT